MILITKENRYINLDNADSWKLEKLEPPEQSGKKYSHRIVIRFGDYKEFMYWQNEKSAEKAFEGIRQGLLNNLLFVKL